MFLFDASKFEGTVLSFGSDVSICVAQSQRTFENEGHITEVKMYLH